MLKIRGIRIELIFRDILVKENGWLREVVDRVIISGLIDSGVIEGL